MLMGSVGWIAAGLLIGQSMVEESAAQFRIAAAAGVVMAFSSSPCPTLRHWAIRHPGRW